MIVVVPVKPERTFVATVPAGARFLAIRSGEVWLSGHEYADKQERKFHTVAKGERMPDEVAEWRYLGTAGELHVYLEVEG